MNRSRPASRNTPRRVRALVLVLFFVFLIFFTPLRPHAEGATATLIEPLLRAARSLGDRAARLRAGFSSNQQLVAQNESLKTELDDLQARLLDRNTLAEENDQLRSMMGRDSVPAGVLAEVLAAPGHAPYDTLLLDVGANKQIKAGDRVVMGENAIIGTITDVYATTAKATLFSSPGAQVDAVLSGTDSFVTAVGQGGGMFEVTLPRDTAIAAGDVLLVPGTQRILGTVGSITVGPTDPFKKVLVRSPFDPSSIRFVRVTPLAS